MHNTTRGVKLTENGKGIFSFLACQVVKISDIITEDIKSKASQGRTIIIKFSMIPYLFKVERDANTL